MEMGSKSTCKKVCFILERHCVICFHLTGTTTNLERHRLCSLKDAGKVLGQALKENGNLKCH